MKNRKCPSRKACLDYDNGNCQNCVFGEKIIKLHKQIDRLKKQNETLTIQRNAWALAAKAVKADTVSELQTRVAVHFGTYTDKDTVKISDVFKLIDEIAKEMFDEI